ncbi:MAG: abortive infection family protein [Candidatus Nomurabacteria bacterium]|jgi:hypothetical protein|nr:abortive infection family protein [Candidatus Nomurabacteria bacterium]
MTDKEKMILDDFTERILYAENTDFLSDSFGTKTKKQLSQLYLKLYSNLDAKYAELFAYWQDRLNQLLEYLNSRRQNGHYTANESRELLGVIQDISDFKTSLKHTTPVVLCEEYQLLFDELVKFLQTSRGSGIPNDWPYINVVKYDPIFSIKKNSNTIKNIESIKAEFNDEYLTKQLDQMEKSIGQNTADAIGKSKELLETCFRTILDRCGIEYNISDDLPKLNKMIKQALKLNSNNQKIQQILGNLSGLATGLAGLRNSEGTGHGKTIGKFQPPSVVEATLAVDMSTALVKFYWSLYKSKIKDRNV